MKGGKGRLVIGGVAVYLDPHTLHGEALTTRSVHSRRRKKKTTKGYESVYVHCMSLYRECIHTATHYEGIRICMCGHILE